MIVMGLGSSSALTTIERPFIGFSAGTGTTTQNASIFWNLDNAVPTNAYRRASNTYCINSGSTASLARVSNYVWSAGAGSIAFTYEGNNSTGTEATYYWVVGGDDITNTKVGTFNLNTTTGNQDITDVGFQPDFVFFAGADTPDMTNANPDHQSWFFGCAKNSTDRNVMAGAAVNGVSTVNSGRHQRTDRCIAFFNSGSAIVSGAPNEIAAEADYVGTVATGTGGFRINVTKAPPATRSVMYLAIKGGSWNTGATIQPAASGNTSITGLNHTPKGMFMRSQSSVVSSNQLVASRWTVGAAESPTSRWALSGGNRDGATAVPVSYRGQLTTAVVRCTQGSADAAVTATVTSSADLTSFQAGGATLAWTVNEASARQILYVTVGDNVGIAHEVTIADQIGITETTTSRLGLTAVPTTDQVGITEATASRLALGAAPSEQVGITESVAVEVSQLNTVPTDQVRVTEAITSRLQMRMTPTTDAVGITESVHSAITQIVKVIPTTDQIGITETVHSSVELTKLIAAVMLQLRLSGGGSNVNPANSIGGAKSTVIGGIISNTLFPNVTKTEATAGQGTYTYRCFYAHNSHSTKTMYDTRIWIEQNTEAGDHVRLGLGASGTDEVEPATVNQSTPPVDVEFFDATDIEDSLSLGDLVNGGGHRAVWIERYVPPNTAAKEDNYYILRASFYSDHD